MISERITDQLILGDEAFQRHDYETALAAFKKALNLLTREADSPTKEKAYGDTFLRIIDVLDLYGKWLDAIVYVDTISNIARSRNFTKLEIEANLRAGRVLVKRGMWEEARTRYRDVLAKAKQNDATSAIAECFYGLAMVCSRLGDLELAKNNAETALKMTEKVDKYNVKGQAMTLVATLDFEMGDTETAIQKFGDAISYLEEMDDSIELARAYNNLGEVYKSLEEYETAAKHYESCVSVAQCTNNRHTEAYGLINAAECLVKEGKVEQAESSISKAEELLENLDDPLGQSHTHFVRGVIASKKKDLTTTQTEFRAHISSLEKQEATFDVGIASYEFACALKEFGENEDAIRMYKKAKLNFKRSNAKLYLEKADEALKELINSN
jgi:tetratricopeptide (TPR) repeat protein